MKKTCLILIMLVSFNFGTLLAGQAPDLAALQADISRIESNNRKAAGLTNMLNSLKIDPNAGMWNFMGRNNNEKNIQKRSLILREISGINDETEKLSQALLNNRDELAAGMGNNLDDHAYMAVLDYIDGLAVKEASGMEFLSASGMNSSDKDPEYLKFLRYKLDTQAQKLAKVQTLIDSMTAKKKALHKPEQTDEIAIIDGYLGKLGDIRSRALDSQDNIRNILK